MCDIQKKFDALPQNLQDKVLDFIEFLEEKKLTSTAEKNKDIKFTWAGALKDLKNKYTSVDLQKKVKDWF